VVGSVGQKLPATALPGTARSAGFFSDRATIHSSGMTVQIMIRMDRTNSVHLVLVETLVSMGQPLPSARSTLKPLMKSIAMPTTARNNRTDSAEPMPTSTRLIVWL
jgi:hypothetical protein